MQNDLSSQSTADQTRPSTTLLSRNAHSWFFWLATLCLAIPLLSRPASLSASSIKINHQAQAPRVSPNVEMPIPDRDQEILIPADGQCLYKSIIVGYLLPNAHDADMFRIRLAMLVGEDKVISTEEVKSDKGDENKDDSKVDSSEQLDADLLRFTFLHLRRKDLLDCLRQPYPFTKLVRDMQEHMGIKNKLWGGIQEIQTIANRLQVTIQEYTPNSDDTKKLTEPDCFVPQNKNSLMTLCIVRDNPTKEEAVNPFADKDIQRAQANSIKDSKHRQHYRALLPMIPDFLINTSQSSYSLPSPYRKNKPKKLLQSRSLPYSTKVKDVTGLEHMEEQKDAVSCANMIKKGINKTDRKLIFKGLQLLKRIKIDHVSNPRRVMEILLDALTSTAAEWESYGIKRHIAKTMRRFVYSMYLVGKKQNKRIHTDDKEKLLNRIKKALDLIKESRALGNGLRFELDVVEAMLKAMPDTTKKTDRWKNSVMATIEAVKDKDPKKLFAVLRDIYKELKEQQSKNWYEIVLYINYLQEKATKNLETLGQLQYLLYFYKQPRWGQTKESSPSKLKLTFQNSAAKMNPANPGGDWHILYAGIEALTYIVQHAVGNKRQQIIKQALESIDKEKPGLAYYFSFSKLKKLGVEYNNWRIREKAIESAMTLAKHNNKIIQQKADIFLSQCKHNKKEDKRVKLLFKSPDKVIPIDNILETEDFRKYKEGVNKLINDQTKILTQKLEKNDKKILQTIKNQKKDLENIGTKLIDRLNQVQKKEGLIDSQSLGDIDLQDDLNTIALKVQDDDPVLLLAILTNQPRNHKASFAQPQSASKGAQVPYYKKYIFSKQGILHHKAHRTANQLQCHIAQTRPAHIIVTLLEWIEKNPEKYVYSLAISVPICHKCQYLLTTVIGYTDHVKTHEKGCLGVVFAWPMPSFAMRYLDRFVLNSGKPFKVTQTILDQLLGISQSTYQTLESQYDNTVQALKHNEGLVNELNIKLNQKVEETEKEIQQLNSQLNDRDNKLNENQLILDNNKNLLNQHKIEHEKTQETIKQLEDKLNKLNEELKKKDKELEKLKEPIKYKGKSLPKDLSNQNLMGYDFTGCAFTYTDLTDTNLENTILANTTCDYQQAFQDHLKENKCEGGDWYQENLPKDLKSIAQVYPRLKTHADKVKLLHIACGLSRLPFYTDTAFYIKVQYWSCALLQLTKKLGDPYGKQIVCSYGKYLNWDTEGYCWSTEYPQKDVNLEEKNPHANFGTYLTHFNNGLVKHKCKSKYNYGFDYYKEEIELNIKGLQKAYPKINNKELQKEACQIGCALSKSYQIRGMLFLFHYLFYQNRLIRLKNSVGIMVKSDIHYNTCINLLARVGIMVKSDIHYNLNDMLHDRTTTQSWNSMT